MTQAQIKQLKTKLNKVTKQSLIEQLVQLAIQDETCYLALSRKISVKQSKPTQRSVSANQCRQLLEFVEDWSQGNIDEQDFDNAQYLLGEIVRPVKFNAKIVPAQMVAPTLIIALATTVLADYPDDVEETLINEAQEMIDQVFALNLTTSQACNQIFGYFGRKTVTCKAGRWGWISCCAVMRPSVMRKSQFLKMPQSSIPTAMRLSIVGRVQLTA